MPMFTVPKWFVWRVMSHDAVVDTGKYTSTDISANELWASNYCTESIPQGTYMYLLNVHIHVAKEFKVCTHLPQYIAMHGPPTVLPLTH